MQISLSLPSTFQRLILASCSMSSQDIFSSAGHTLTMMRRRKAPYRSQDHPIGSPGASPRAKLTDVRGGTGFTATFVLDCCCELTAT